MMLFALAAMDWPRALRPEPSGSFRPVRILVKPVSLAMVLISWEMFSIADQATSYLRRMDSFTVSWLEVRWNDRRSWKQRVAIAGSSA